MSLAYGLSWRHFFNLFLSFLSGMTSFSLKQSSKESLSFAKNRHNHLTCSLTSLDTELYFYVKTHKEWFLWRPLKANSDRASRFLFISLSAEQSSIMNSVWWPFNAFLNNFIHSFNLPSMSHTIKTFLSSKIHFLERYVLLSKIVGHRITMNSKWLLYMVSSSWSKNSVFLHDVQPMSIAEWGNFGRFIFNILHLKIEHHWYWFERPEICTNSKTTCRLTQPFWLSVIEFLLKCFLIVCLSRGVYYRLWF